MLPACGRKTVVGKSAQVTGVIMDQHLEAGVRGFEVGNESIALGQGFCTVIFLHMNIHELSSHHFDKPPEVRRPDDFSHPYPLVWHCKSKSSCSVVPS